LDGFGQALLSPGLDAGLDAVLPLEGAIYHRPLMHAPAAIVPTERHVHDHIEGDEALAAARRPHHAQAVAGNEPLDEVTAICAELDLAEGHEIEPACPGLGLAIVG